MKPLKQHSVLLPKLFGNIWLHQIYVVKNSTDYYLKYNDYEKTIVAN